MEEVKATNNQLNNTNGSGDLNELDNPNDDYTFNDPTTAEEYRCCICQETKSDIMHLANCIHILCKECTQHKHMKTKCPLCQETLVGMSYSNHLSHKAGRLLVTCSHCHASNIELRHISYHLLHACPHVKHHCGQCQSTFMGDTSLHVGQCIARVVRCPACQDPVAWNKLDDHKLKCPERNIVCLLCSETHSVRLAESWAHDQMLVSCPYQSLLGCSCAKMPRKALAGYLKQAEVMVMHFGLLIARLDKPKENKEGDSRREAAAKVKVGMLAVHTATKKKLGVVFSVTSEGFCHTSMGRFYVTEVDVMITDNTVVSAHVLEKNSATGNTCVSNKFTTNT